MALFLVLHESVNSGILKMKKDNRPQGGLPGELGRKIRPYSRQSFGAVFLCSNYFLSFKVTMNVSNAMINSPKIIRS